MKRGKQKGKKRGFLHGALVLTGGMAVVKILGALFKVPLTYVIGEYGIGLFNVAYHFFGPVFSLATIGFSTAVSRLVSENSSLGRWNDARQVKKTALPLFLGVGSCGMTIMLLLAPLYCRWVTGAAFALAPMIALAPAVLLACAASVYRGYYEGLGNMAPTAFSQVLEAVVKLGLGLVLAWLVTMYCQEEYLSAGTVVGLVPEDEDHAAFLTMSFGAAGALLGVAAGSLLSLAYLALRFRIHGDGTPPRLYRQSPPARSAKEIRRQLWAVTLPIALGSLTTNAAGLIDATILQSRVGSAIAVEPQRFLSACGERLPQEYAANFQAVPTYLYGCYTLAMTIALLVPGITQAFGTSALPTVTAAWAKGGRKELRARMEAVVRVTSLFCFPAGLGIAALAAPIARLLYGSAPSVPLIGEALAVLGIASIASAMSGPLSSVLQAVGRADLPVKLLLGAVALKLGITWVLCGIPEVHVLGAGVAALASYGFLVISQLWCMRRVTGIPFSTVSVLLRPLACALLCAMSARTVYEFLAPMVPGGRGWQGGVLGISVVFGGILYIAGLLLLKGIPKSELASLPMGQKIVKMLEKQGWI